MAIIGKIYNRIPKQVIGNQWFPYSGISHVKDIIIKVPELPQSSYTNIDPILGADMSNAYANGLKTIEVCTHGEVILGSNQKPSKVNPRDFVIYNVDSGLPIGIVPEKDFLDMYTDQFELCPDCNQNAAKMRGELYKKEEPLSINQIIELIRSGQGYDIGNGVIIKSEQELIEYAQKVGVKA